MNTYHCSLSLHICFHIYRVSTNECNAFNVYCSECPPGGTIGNLGGQQKMIMPFGHERDLAAFKGTGLQNKSFQDRAEIGLNPFGTHKMTSASGPIHYAPTDPHRV